MSALQLKDNSCFKMKLGSEVEKKLFDYISKFKNSKQKPNQIYFMLSWFGAFISFSLEDSFYNSKINFQLVHDIEMFKLDNNKVLVYDVQNFDNIYHMLLTVEIEIFFKFIQANKQQNLHLEFKINHQDSKLEILMKDSNEPCNYSLSKIDYPCTIKDNCNLLQYGILNNQISKIKKIKIKFNDEFKKFILKSTNLTSVSLHRYITPDFYVTIQTKTVYNENKKKTPVFTNINKISTEVMVIENLQELIKNHESFYKIQINFKYLKFLYDLSKNNKGDKLEMILHYQAGLNYSNDYYLLSENNNIMTECTNKENIFVPNVLLTDNNPILTTEYTEYDKYISYEIDIENMNINWENSENDENNINKD